MNVWMNSGQWTTDRAHAHCLLRWAKKGVHLNLHWTDWPKNRQTTRWLLYIASSNFVWQKRENDKNEKCCRNIAQNSSDLFILTEKAMPCLFSSAYSPFQVYEYARATIWKRCRSKVLRPLQISTGETPRKSEK